MRRRAFSENATGAIETPALVCGVEVFVDDEMKYWEGYRLNPDGTIQFSAIVDYGILGVPTGAIFQFNHAASQAEMDSGRLSSIQLHMSAHHIRECANELLRIADQLGA